MKVKLQQEANILSVPEGIDVASLETIDDTYYSYRVYYQVDPSRAAKLGAYKVKITVTRQPKTRTQVSTFTIANATNVSIVQALLNSASRTKDAIRATTDSSLFTYVSDVTSKIPNSSASSLQKASFSQTTKTLNLMSVADMTALNIQVPVLQTPTVQRSTPASVVIDQTAIKLSSMAMLFNSQLDPATAANKTRLTTTAGAVLAGTLTRAPTINNSLLVDSFISLAPTILTADTVLPVQSVQTTSYVNVDELLEIPVKDLSLDEFYLTFDLVDGNNVSVETVSRVVKHSKNVAVLLTPTLPPQVFVSSPIKLGKTLLDIKQVDPNAKGVKIYRRAMSFDNQNSTANYVYAGKVDATSNDSWQRFEDVFSNYNPVIYRIIPYNQDGVLASEFEGVVSVAQQTSLVKAVAAKHTPKFAVILVTTGDSGIRVDVKDIPTGPTALQLFRQDMSTASKNVVALDKPNPITSTGNALVSFTDTTVQTGRIYRYTCKLFYRDGKVVDVPNSATVEYNPEISNIVNTTLSNMIVVNQDADMPDVSFDITTSFIETSEDRVRAALTNQGLLTYYDASIDQDALQNLVAYRVVRTNNTTGISEDFGVITSKTFSDLAQGVVKGVKPLESGNDYTYLVTTHFRSANTLLANYVKQITYDNFPSQNYSFSPAKWMHPIVLSKGNLVSESSLVANYAKNQFTFGQVGSISSISVSLSKSQPSIFKATATRVNSTLVKIQWQVQGTLNKIDHFIVTVDTLGNRSIAGKSHNISDSGQFQFIDKLTDGEKGALVYIITPVFHDYTRGNEFKTNRIFV